MWSEVEYENEYSIIMLKPDCIINNMDTEIISIIQANNFTIISEKERYLIRQDVFECFLHPTEEYISFLTSGIVRFYLVSGINAHKRLYQLKKQIRYDKGVQNKIRNLIHTADQGNEYHKLLAHFFPELEPEKYCNLVDQNIVFHKNQDIYEFINTLEHLDKESPLKYGAINICNMNQDDLNVFVKKDRWSSFILSLTFDITIDVSDDYKPSALIYFKNYQYINTELIRYINAVLRIDNLRDLMTEYDIQVYFNNLYLTQKEIDKYRLVTKKSECEVDKVIKSNPIYMYLEEITNIGIKGCVCFRPDFTLIETEYYMDLCRLLSIDEGGGSSGLVQPGQFSVSAYCI